MFENHEELQNNDIREFIKSRDAYPSLDLLEKVKFVLVGKSWAGDICRTVCGSTYGCREKKGLCQRRGILESRFRHESNSLVKVLGKKRIDYLLFSQAQKLIQNAIANDENYDSDLEKVKEVFYTIQEAQDDPWVKFKHEHLTPNLEDLRAIL